MKREFLKELELTDEAIDKIMAENGKDIEGFKSKVSTLETERDGLKTQLDEANTQIEGFKELDVDGIKAAADEWKQKAEQAEKDSDAKLAELKFNHALESKLAGTKAKDAAIVAGLLDRDALKLTEDGILGLDEQLSKIKEEKGFLFESEDDKDPKLVIGGGTGGSLEGDANEASLRAAMGLGTDKGDK